MGLIQEERRALSGAGLAMEPLAVSIADAVKISGLSRSEIYRRGAAGDIEIVKNGSRSLVVVASIRRFLASLPPAELRAPKQANAAE